MPLSPVHWCESTTAGNINRWKRLKIKCMGITRTEAIADFYMRRRYLRSRSQLRGGPPDPMLLYHQGVVKGWKPLAYRISQQGAGNGLQTLYSAEAPPVRVSKISKYLKTLFDFFKSGPFQDLPKPWPLFGVCMLILKAFCGRKPCIRGIDKYV